METISSYRDSVNDSPWKCVESLPSQKLVMAMPENYVLDGPVFYIMPPENGVDVVIYREPKQRMAWGLLHPSGNSILFCTDQRELLLYRNEDRTIHWNVDERQAASFLGSHVSLSFHVPQEKRAGTVHDGAFFRSGLFPDQ